MNISPVKLVGAVIGSLVGALLLVRIANGVYFNERADLNDRIERLDASLANAEREATDHLRVDERIQGFSDRTLGTDRESTDHGLRTALNRLGATVGLAEQSVSTRAVTPRKSPARRTIKSRDLRDTIDFTELEGVLTGRGTLEQAIDLVCRLEAEPWIKRVSQLRLDPLRKGKRLAITLSVSTVFVPGRSPQSPLSEVDPSDIRTARFAALLDRRPFERARKPKPVEAAPVAPSFPWDQWRVTGLAHGPGGPEVWLSNSTSGDTLTLLVGQQIDAVTFVGPGPDVDHAVFTVGGNQFEVRVGASLDQRILH